MLLSQQKTGWVKGCQCNSSVSKNKVSPAQAGAHVKKCAPEALEGHKLGHLQSLWETTGKRHLHSFAWEFAKMCGNASILRSHFQLWPIKRKPLVCKLSKWWKDLCCIPVICYFVKTYSPSHSKPHQEMKSEDEEGIRDGRARLI